MGESRASKDESYRLMGKMKYSSQKGKQKKSDCKMMKSKKK